MALVPVDAHPKLRLLPSVDVTIPSLHHGVCLPGGATNDVSNNG